MGSAAEPIQPLKLPKGWTFAAGPAVAPVTAVG
jgi:hypothetical protein